MVGSIARKIEGEHCIVLNQRSPCEHQDLQSRRKPLPPYVQKKIEPSTFSANPKTSETHQLNGVFRLFLETHNETINTPPPVSLALDQLLGILSHLESSDARKTFQNLAKTRTIECLCFEKIATPAQTGCQLEQFTTAHVTKKNPKQDEGSEIIIARS